MRPLIVGEQNPYGDAPGLALYPEPRGCAGWRLCRLILCMEPDEYLTRFDRVNLLGRGPWSNSRARESARRIWDSTEGRLLILLGSRVSAAFGRPTGLWSALWVGGRPRVARIPHPSGLARAWNETGAYLRARELILTLTREVENVS